LAELCLAFQPDEVSL